MSLPKKRRVEELVDCSLARNFLDVLFDRTLSAASFMQAAMPDTVCWQMSEERLKIAAFLKRMAIAIEADEQSK